MHRPQTGINRHPSCNSGLLCPPPCLANAQFSQLASPPLLRDEAAHLDGDSADMHVLDINNAPQQEAHKGPSDAPPAAHAASSLRRSKPALIITGTLLLLIVAAAVIIPCAILLRPKVGRWGDRAPFDYRSLSLPAPLSRPCCHPGPLHH